MEAFIVYFKIYITFLIIEWFPTNLDSAHAVMQYNIAVCKTLRGQLDQAAALLKQIWQGRGPTCKVPALIIMLVLYIELQLGESDLYNFMRMSVLLQFTVCFNYKCTALNDRPLD